MPGSRRTDDSLPASTGARTSALRITPGFVRKASAALLGQFVKNFIDDRGREVFMKDMVDHHHGRPGASCEALLFALQINAPVRRALAGLDAEFLLDMIQDFSRAAQHATNILPHCNRMSATRLA